MDLFIVKIIIVLIATGIAALTDFKTGYIYDWITYPFIGLGVLISIIEGNFTSGLLFGAMVFIFGALLYYSGKLGGGDVKLFTGIPFYFPTYNGLPFILIVILCATFSALLFYGFDNIIYLSKKPPRNFVLNIFVAIAVAVLVGMFFKRNIYIALFFFVISFLALITLMFKENIVSARYKKEIKVSELLDDDLADLTVIGKGEMVPLDKKLLEQIQKKLKQDDKITVYRDMPVFGPFIFLGTIIAFIWLYYNPVFIFVI